MKADRIRIRAMLEDYFPEDGPRARSFLTEAIAQIIETAPEPSPELRRRIVAAVGSRGRVQEGGLPEPAQGACAASVGRAAPALRCRVCGETIWRQPFQDFTAPTGERWVLCSPACGRHYE